MRRTRWYKEVSTFLIPSERTTLRTVPRGTSRRGASTKPAMTAAQGKHPAPFEVIDRVGKLVGPSRTEFGGKLFAWAREERCEPDVVSWA